MFYMGSAHVKLVKAVAVVHWSCETKQGDDQAEGKAEYLCYTARSPGSGGAKNSTLLSLRTNVQLTLCCDANKAGRLSWPPFTRKWTCTE